MLIPVELGLRARDQVEITKGLKSGDIVVSQAQSRLSKDTKVKVHDQKAAQVERSADVSSGK